MKILGIKPGIQVTRQSGWSTRGRSCNLATVVTSNVNPRKLTILVVVIEVWSPELEADGLCSVWPDPASALESTLGRELSQVVHVQRSDQNKATGTCVLLLLCVGTQQPRLSYMTHVPCPGLTDPGVVLRVPIGG